MKQLSLALAAIMLLGLSMAAQATITIETVPVGDVGNTADTTGYGSVGYAYNIGKYLVTAEQYTAFLNAVAKTDTYGLYNTQMWTTTRGCKIQRSGSSGNYTYSVASDYADRPVNYVSWGSAARFANWMHNDQPTGAQDLTTTEDGAYFLNGATSTAALNAVKRKADWIWAITSEDEWYKAAYYKSGGTDAGYWLYPTQSDSVPGRDLDDVSGNNANYFGSPYPIQSPYYTTIVGQFHNSDSAYGTFDQGGNLNEWNEAIPVSNYRGRRGGPFSTGATTMQSTTRGHEISNWTFDHVGFRVVVVPEQISSITIVEAKKLADGPATTISLSNKLVSAVFSEHFYVEEADKSGGIRVTPVPSGLAIGNSVDIQGEIATTSDGERVVLAISVEVNGGEIPGPKYVTNRAVGGGDTPEYDAGAGTGQMGVEDGGGLDNNIGLLIETSGYVTTVGKDFFYIDDGTNARDFAVFRGIRVRWEGLPKPESGANVSVTGISSLMKIQDRVFRSIIPRTEIDIQVQGS